MDISTWFIFCGIAFLSIISPGPAILLSVTNSLNYGFKNSLFSTFGNFTGLFIVSLTASLGLGALLKTSVLLFSVFKIAGAIYLIYLGFNQIRAKKNLFDNNLNIEERSRKKLSLFIQGLFVALSNPKAILFFTALFPHFIDIKRPVIFQFTVLTFTFMGFSFLSLIFFARSALSLKLWLSNNNRINWFNRGSGVIFISLGLGILRMSNKNV